MTPTKLRFTSLAALMLLAGLSTSAFAQTYNVTDLGPFNGAPTFATAINDSGTIAGFSLPAANSARTRRRK